ncbi:TIGR02594 family protein [Microvirga zambiensis]|uniref:NlpC/P60 family protein n=1 Tax=Microvirga zambiensis TaxID=1402137 RepID=UPI00191EB4E9|nr:TIGR02594 family protein [Microvirga zambiensis]
MNVAEIQRALLARGYALGNSGPTKNGVDGDWGRLSTAAAKDFQAKMGLKVTGQPDETTIVALGLRKAGPVLPVWHIEAERLKGVKEIAGAKSNPTILGWAKALGGWVASFYKNDDTPWCGLFIGHVIGKTLPGEVLPSNPLGALNWLTFGRALTVPTVGAIAVFKRPGGGHVGLYVGEDATAVHVLGGNQSNTVNVTRVGKDRLQGYRWPTTAAAPATGRVHLTSSGKLSTNEA